VKPEVESFQACLLALSLEPKDCVFVGDGGSDELVGAKAAGLRTVFVSGVIENLFPERIPARIAVADHHIRRVPELLALLGLSTAPAPSTVA
jgi:putative hydrolase of the HAD superfamily